MILISPEGIGTDPDKFAAHIAAGRTDFVGIAAAAEAGLDIDKAQPVAAVAGIVAAPAADPDIGKAQPAAVAAVAEQPKLPEPMHNMAAAEYIGLAYLGAAAMMLAVGEAVQNLYCPEALAAAA